MDRIAVECPNCHAEMKAARERLGQTRPCPKCKQPFVIEPKVEFVRESAEDFLDQIGVEPEPAEEPEAYDVSPEPRPTIPTFSHEVDEPPTHERRPKEKEPWYFRTVQFVGTFFWLIYLAVLLFVTAVGCSTGLILGLGFRTSDLINGVIYGGVFAIAGIPMLFWVAVTMLILDIARSTRMSRPD